MAMRLDVLLAGIAPAGQHGDIVVNGLGLDSRALAEGDAFVALQGSSMHGVRFVAEAARRGARVVLAEAPTPA
ncbi:MAG: Mur ligase domain-containing protein, partial [Dokdonella sp.]